MPARHLWAAAATATLAASLAVAGPVVGVAQAGAAPQAPGGAVAAPETGGDAARDAADERRFLSRIRRLTLDGPRAGEGYFSADGRRLVFQSEREPGNPFYQIYELDLTSGDLRRVSPGQGKTTCAFYVGDTRQILFASTHHDPQSTRHQREELERRASGNERRYAWDFDPQMELYQAAPDGTLRRITDVEGYDAEASVSPDGRWIVFTSTRNAYGRSLSDAERRQLEVDPSVFAELYVMRSDGSELRRITDAHGYDGGPFFMPDGERVVWRRFDPEGLIADVWIARRDGSDARAITDFRSMSWAPYPHPSGEYVIFTSNKLGFENFEIFIVDADGTREPVRVTTTAGFDGLPVFSPDGNGLAWTSTRGSEGGQLYLARWNHEAARQALQQAPPRGATRSEP